MLKEKKAILIKKAVSKELTDFLTNYFKVREQVCITLKREGFIPFNSFEWGTHEDKQVDSAYSIYGDFAGDVLLEKLIPKMKEVTKSDLVPTYSYCRVYKHGNVLIPHVDRFSCDISTTLCLGGDPWPFWYKKNNKKIKVDMEPGDMLAYLGNEIEHWRDKFEGQECVQIFLHYNLANHKLADKNIYDGREHLGLPNYFGKLIDDKNTR